MYTRKQMFDDNSAEFAEDRGHGAHRRFYGEVVRECAIKPPAAVLKEATKERMEADPYMNNVRDLRWWDAHAYHLMARRDVRDALKARGDFMSQAGALCLLKEAVRQHHEGN